MGSKLFMAAAHVFPTVENVIPTVFPLREILVRGVFHGPDLFLPLLALSSVIPTVGNVIPTVGNVFPTYYVIQRVGNVFPTVFPHRK